MTLDAATGHGISNTGSSGAAGAAGQGGGVRVPLPFLFIGLMILVIFSVFDILEKTYDANLVSNRRVAKAVLDGAMSKADAELDGLALGLAAGYSAANPEKEIDLAEALSGELSGRSADALVVFLDAAGQPMMILKGGKAVAEEQFGEVAAAMRLSPATISALDGARSAARFISMGEIVYLLSSRYGLVAGASDIGATGLMIGMPAADLLRKELERYEIFRSGSLKKLLDRAQTDGFKSVADLIIETQKMEYREFQLNVVAQIVTVLMAFVICVMIARRIDEKNDELRDSYHIIAEREREANRQRNRAEQASEAKSRLIANMSHELRTPLNGILGYAEMIASEVFGKLEGRKERYREYAENIHASGLRLQKELSQVLEYSSISRGDADLDKKPIDFKKLINEAIKEYRERADKRGIELVALIGPELPVYLGDAAMLGGLLQHLVSNAVKFGKQDGSVKIQVRYSEYAGAIELRVRDDGIGMEQKSVISMFQPFAQGGDVYARNHQGTGLGLALAKCYAVAHNAGISVKSSPGKGTLVTVHFKLSDNAEDNAEQPADHTETADCPADDSAGAQIAKAASA